MTVVWERKFLKHFLSVSSLPSKTYPSNTPPPRRRNGGGGRDCRRGRTDDNGERDPTRVSREPTPPLRVACDLSINIYRYFSFFISIIILFYRLFVLFVTVDRKSAPRTTATATRRTRSVCIRFPLLFTRLFFSPYFLESDASRSADLIIFPRNRPSCYSLLVSAVVSSAARKSAIVRRPPSGRGRHRPVRVVCQSVTDRSRGQSSDGPLRRQSDGKPPIRVAFRYVFSLHRNNPSPAAPPLRREKKNETLDV